MKHGWEVTPHTSFLPAETPRLHPKALHLNSSPSCPSPNGVLAQGTRLTPMFPKNAIYLLFELHTQVGYKWRVTTALENKGICWAAINNKLHRKNSSPTLGFVLLWLSTISTKFWQSCCHYLLTAVAPGTCSARSKSPLCTYWCVGSQTGCAGLLCVSTLSVPRGSPLGRPLWIQTAPGHISPPLSPCFWRPDCAGTTVLI